MEDHYPYPIPTCQAEVPFLVEDLIFCSKVNNYSLHQFQSICTSLSSKEIPFLVEELQFCSKVGPWPKCPTNYPSVNLNFENNKRKFKEIILRTGAMKLISAHVSVMPFIHSILHLANKLIYTSVIIKI